MAEEDQSQLVGRNPSLGQSTPERIPIALLTGIDQHYAAVSDQVTGAEPHLDRVDLHIGSPFEKTTTKRPDDRR